MVCRRLRRLAHRLYKKYVTFRINHNIRNRNLMRVDRESFQLVLEHLNIFTFVTYCGRSYDSRPVDMQQSRLQFRPTRSQGSANAKLFRLRPRQMRRSRFLNPTLDCAFCVANILTPCAAHALPKFKLTIFHDNGFTTSSKFYVLFNLSHMKKIKYTYTSLYVRSL